MSDLDTDFARILDGEATHEEIKDFLSASVERMGDPAALVAGARALRARMIAVEAPQGAIDVCGTGGDGAHTLNISTAVAFVVAGCGVPVAKHGNRAMSSRSGAADVLEALGVKLTGDVPTLERCLREANVAFLFAQNHHPSMRHVAAARKELGHRTIFNLLGPLANPARVKRQLLGVFAQEFVEPVAQALRELATERSWVLHGIGGLDELSCDLEGENTIVDISQDNMRHFTVMQSDADRCAFPNSAVAGGSAQENAAALRALLELNGDSYYQEIVLMNAGAALVVAGRAETLSDGAHLAWHTLGSENPRDALEMLIAITQAAPERAP